MGPGNTPSGGFLDGVRVAKNRADAAERRLKAARADHREALAELEQSVRVAIGVGFNERQVAAAIGVEPWLGLALTRQERAAR